MAATDSECTARITEEGHVVIPPEVMDGAGLRVGDEVSLHVAGTGRVEITSPASFIRRFAGTMPPGVYPAEYLDDLRNEWER